MAVSPLFRPVAVAAGIFSVVQATVWSILSLIGILASTDIIKLDLPLKNLYNFFGVIVKELYFEDNQSLVNAITVCAKGDLLSHDDVLVIVSIYFAVSVIWLMVSIVQLADAYNFELKHTRNILYVWSAVTGAVILLDFAVTVCFGRDYNSLVSTDDANCYPLLVTVATMMALAARGFVLWCINVAFLVYLARAAYVLMEEDIGMYARKTSEESSISSLYQPPNMDSYPQESRSIQYQLTGHLPPPPPAPYSFHATAPMYDTGIQSPQVGDSPRSPWSFPAPRHLPPPAPVRPPPAPRYHPPAQPPPQRHIPEPDYDESPPPRRSKHEPRPFNEVPRRSALKKDREARSYF